nr:DUF1826 domain-containing protein [Pseudooceanicola algae]
MRSILNAGVSGVAAADTPTGLSAILKPDCAAAIWRRRPLPALQVWIDALDPDRLPGARVILRPDVAYGSIRQTVLGICDAAATPDCPERDLLIDDIVAQVAMFARLMPSRYLRLRLDVVTTNACRKFHVDMVTARLVCTYRGTGTQYGIGPDPARIHTVPTGAPILLRGTLWPVEPDAGVRHRSPPIEGTGEVRLVLVLDPLDDAEEAQ